MCVLPLTAEHAEDVKGVLRLEATTVVDSVSPLISVRAAMSAAPWFAERARRYLGAVPILLEKECSFVAHRKMLDMMKDGPCFQAECPLVEFAALVDDVHAIMQKLGSEAVDGLLTETMTCLEKLVAEAITLAKTSPQSQTWWQRFSALLANASIAFPLDINIAAWVNESAAIQQQTSTQELMDAMNAKLKGFLESPQDSDVPELLKALNLVAGVEPPEAVLENVQLLLVKLTTTLTSAGFKPAGEECRLIDEALRFVPQESDWRVLLVWVHGAVSLAKHTDFLTRTDYSEAEMSEFHQSLVVVGEQQKAMQDHGLKLDATMMASVCRTSLELHTKLNDKHKAAMNSLADTAKINLQAAMDALLPLAYGDDAKPGESWSAKLHAKSTVEDAVHLARTGLLAIDSKRLQELMDGAVVAKDKYSQACDNSGAVYRDEGGMYDIAEKLVQRAALTLSEQEIVRLIQGNADKEVARFAVKAAVARIRAHKSDEKKVLPLCLYKWAFMTLTGRAK